VYIKQIRNIAALAAAGWDPAYLSRELISDQDMGPILEEEVTDQRPEWKDIANRSPKYKSDWAQWKLLAVWKGILQSHWEIAHGRSKLVQLILPLDQSERHAHRTTGWIISMSLECQQDPK
jgi:hypothetical protein